MHSEANLMLERRDGHCAATTRRKRGRERTVTIGDCKNEKSKVAQPLCHSRKERREKRARRVHPLSATPGESSYVIPGTNIASEGKKRRERERESGYGEG